MITADITDYDQRVRTGRTKETSIVETLKRAGVRIEPPTEYEDTKQGIDAWIVDESGRHSLQIKGRETGDDIIFEVIKDIAQNIMGRDFQSVAEYYLVVDRDGLGRMVKTADIKARAKALHDTARQDWANRTGRRAWEGPGWELKVTVDRAHGNAKLMAYFSPTLFKAFGSWRFSL
jgi:hypothetical protein